MKSRLVLESIAGDNGLKLQAAIDSYREALRQYRAYLESPRAASASESDRHRLAVRHARRSLPMDIALDIEDEIL